VVGSSTAGSFGYGDAPQVVGPDDYEADQSRMRSADRSRPSRDRATHVDNSPHDAPPQIPHQVPQQVPHQAPSDAPHGQAAQKPPHAAPGKRDAATAAATGAPARKAAE
jgi:hypothetical protein